MKMDDDIEFQFSINEKHSKISSEISRIKLTIEYHSFYDSLHRNKVHLHVYSVISCANTRHNTQF